MKGYAILKGDLKISQKRFLGIEYLEVECIRYRYLFSFFLKGVSQRRGELPLFFNDKECIIGGMKLEIVKFYCDLCGKELENISYELKAVDILGEDKLKGLSICPDCLKEIKGKADTFRKTYEENKKNLLGI